MAPVHEDSHRITEESDRSAIMHYTGAHLKLLAIMSLRYGMMT